MVDPPVSTALPYLVDRLPELDPLIVEAVSSLCCRSICTCSTVMVSTVLNIWWSYKAIKDLKANLLVLRNCTTWVMSQSYFHYGDSYSEIRREKVRDSALEVVTDNKMLLRN
ncbi:hypothetical protein MRB53_001984 [Persea americana]|uniref:Uncharacterized protein n=1 Tax=Persea americana TaxID=3435 RepID=A0ACC2MTG1_PERAE|nr:hypothetical protein MRB53_001984 [Persea americana]